MATNITSAFIDMWNAEVKHAYQQKTAKLRPYVRSVSGVVGATHKFHTLGAVTANTKARDADITPLNPAQAVKTATLADRYAGIYLDDLDQVKSNADFRREYVQAGAAALGRFTDDVIITAALSASGLVTAPTTGGGLTFAKLNEAREALDAADVDPSERCIVVSPAAMSDVLAEEKLTSADYMNLKAVINGQVDSALGFKWIMSTRLPSAGSPSVRQCFAFHKAAIGLAVGKDLQTKINYSVDKDSWLALSTISLGAVRIEDTGVVAIDVVGG